MSDAKQGEAANPALHAGDLIDQMFALWILPYAERSNLDVSHDQISQAVVILHPNGAPEVLLNDQAELVAKAKVSGAVAVGEPVTAENVEHLSALRPANVPPDAGWIAFALLPGGGIMVAFDFR